MTLISPAQAQEPDLELWLENHSAYSDPSELLELLKEFEKNPINLNEATEEQLGMFPLLTPLQARAIVLHRQKIGAFHSLADLSQIDLIDRSLFLILTKYFTVGSLESSQRWTFNSKSRFHRKLGASHGTDDSARVASPTKTYQRVDVRYDDRFRAGLLLEKDSGERRLDDLMVYFFSYHNPSTGNRVLLGNYRLEFAQGLIFGDPYGYYKGAAANQWATRRSRELVEYTIVDENASLYGVSAKLCFKIYQLFLFLSHNKLDASLNGEGKIKNFYDTGLHRTPSELARKDQLSEQLYGTRLVIKPTPQFSLGATYYRSVYSPPIAMQDEPLHRFSLQGRSNFVIGTDFQFTLRTVHLFSEFARSQNHAPALISGVLLRIRPFDLIVSYRNYSEQFINPHGFSFSEQGEHPQNEQGIFWGMQFVPSSRLKVTFYFDQFVFPWRSYFIDTPARGRDAMLQTEFRPMKNVKLTGQYRFKQKDRQTGEIREIFPRIEHRGRAQLEAQIDDHLTLRGRIERKWVIYRNLTPIPPAHRQQFNSLLLFQDIIIRIKNNVDLVVRLGWFDSDHYESRLYQFEHDVAGVFTNQMLNGIGTRHYLRLQWQPYPFLQLSLKIGSTQYNYYPVTGSEFAQNSSISETTMNFQMEIRR